MTHCLSAAGSPSVSYTHLDVYKRQVLDVEVPEQYTKMQEFDYTMPFGDVHITCAMNEAEDAFYLYFTAFDDLQILEGVIEEGEPIVTFDRSGFMAGDAQNFLNQINPDAWVQR